MLAVNSAHGRRSTCITVVKGYVTLGVLDTGVNLVGAASIFIPEQDLD
jgi:hypothetical protein